jgi:hypothetical protein
MSYCNFPNCTAYGSKSCDNCSRDYCSDHILQGTLRNICPACLLESGADMALLLQQAGIKLEPQVSASTARQRTYGDIRKKRGRRAAFLFWVGIVLVFIGSILLGSFGVTSLNDSTTAGWIVEAIGLLMTLLACRFYWILGEKETSLGALGVLFILFGSSTASRGGNLATAATIVAIIGGVMIGGQIIIGIFSDSDSWGSGGIWLIIWGGWMISAGGGWAIAGWILVVIGGLVALMGLIKALFDR